MEFYQNARRKRKRRSTSGRRRFCLYVLILISFPSLFSVITFHIKFSDHPFFRRDCRNMVPTCYKTTTKALHRYSCYTVRLLTATCKVYRKMSPKLAASDRMPCRELRDSAGGSYQQRHCRLAPQEDGSTPLPHGPPHLSPISRRRTICDPLHVTQFLNIHV